MTVSSLDLGPVTVLANQTLCNSSSSQQTTHPFSITGAGNASASVSISNSNIRTFFMEVKLSNAVLTSGSSIILNFEEANALPSIMCGEHPEESSAEGFINPAFEWFVCLCHG
jgi:hypothetical protein